MAVNMKRIIVYTENYEPGGGNRYMVDFLVSLPAGIHVSLYSNIEGLFPQDRERLAGRVDLIEVPVRSEEWVLRRLSGGGLRRLFSILFRISLKLPIVRAVITLAFGNSNRRLLRAAIRKGSFCAAIAFNGGFPAAISTVDFLAEARKAGLRTAIVIVSMPTPSGYKDRIYARDLDGIDLFVVNCHAIASSLAVTRGIPAERIKVLYNSVAAQPVVPAVGEVASTGGTHFGFIGRLEKSKGVFTLIEAFGACTRLPAGTTLSLYGKIFNEKELRLAISKAFDPSSIRIKGPFVGKAHDVLEAMDVLVLPSFREGFPYVIMEAMSAGVAVIASRVGGIPEAVEDGYTGLLVEPGDARQLAQAIETLATDSYLRSSLGRTGMKVMMERFNWDNYKSDVYSILENLMERT
jgi:glycosyltransferase involved in cell wall biosynthesis